MVAGRKEGAVGGTTAPGWIEGGAMSEVCGGGGVAGFGFELGFGGRIEGC